MVNPETARIFDERYESALHERRTAFPQEVRRLQERFASRGILSSGFALNDLTELYRTEVKNRSERAFVLLQEVLSDIEPASPTLAADMKALLKAKVEGQFTELNTQYLRDAGGAALASGCLSCAGLRGHHL